MQKLNVKRSVSIRLIIMALMIGLALLCFGIMFLSMTAMGVIPLEAVYADTSHIRVALVVSILLTLWAASMFAFITSRYLAMRIERVSDEIRRANPENGIHLTRTNIREIDTLEQVIEQVGHEIAHYSAHMTTIVAMVGEKMGAFEVRLDQTGKNVYLTSSLFHVLGIPQGDASSSVIDIEQLTTLFPGLILPTEPEVPVETVIEKKNTDNNAQSIYRIRMLLKDGVVYATVVDDTEEITCRRHLEFERDYDTLTKILNRKSFPIKAEALINNSPDKIGALIFGDLDSLKSINDTFGHDIGDRYICNAAEALRKFENIGGIVARISGDEFAVYLHGRDSKDDLRAEIDEVTKHIRLTEVCLPNGDIQNCMISLGLAYYPEDATSISMLMRYADFAMYEIKSYAKGKTCEFDKERYIQNSEALMQPTYIDRMMSENRIRFAFQPIVEVKTASLLGFEALMRPQNREGSTPRELLSLAKSASMLDQLEKHNILSVLSWLGNHRDELGDRKLFINIIASLPWNEEKNAEIFEALPKHDNPLVMEMIDELPDGRGLFTQNAEHIRAAGCQIAIDHYGQSLSDETLILSVKPDYVKVDMSIFRNNRQPATQDHFLKKIIRCASEQGIYVIIAGIETKEELKMAIHWGADFVQGFYIGLPNYSIAQNTRAVLREIAEINGA